MTATATTTAAAPQARSLTAKGKRVRDHIVATAEALFADRGFHGASMRDLAAAAGIPLATAVYHFARKEQLYAAVLGVIADELLADAAAAGTAASTTTAQPAAALDAFLLALVRWSLREPQRVRLLLREVLDNPGRVARASQLPLAPYLERGTAILAAAIRAGHARAEEPELSLLSAIGGVLYLVAVRPTAARIVGKARAAQLAAAHEHAALAIARRALAIPHTPEPCRGR